MWRSYAKGLTKAFTDLTRSVTYIVVPEWATARLVYFLHVRLGYMYTYLYMHVVSLLLVYAWSHQYTPLQRISALA